MSAGVDAYYHEDLSWQSQGLMDQLDETRERETEAKAARARASTPEEIAAADEELRAVWLKFWTIRMSCRVMEDTPVEELVPILNVHVLDSSVEQWCARAVAHGGPEIDPVWLRAYIDDHMAGRPREYDPRVHEALVTIDSRVIVPSLGLVYVDTGKKVPMKARASSAASPKP